MPVRAHDALLVATREGIVFDILFLGVVIAFFGLSALLVRACDRI